MVGAYLAPGVYVEELPGGARAIEGVSTSNTLFLGYTRRGPTDEAVRISSWADYVETFGGIVEGASQGINDYRSGGPAGQDVDLMGHALFAYFQNGGRVAYVQRVIGAVTAGAPAAASLSTMQPEPMTFQAANPGTWGDGLEVVVTANAFDAGQWDITVQRTDASGRTTPLEVFEGLEASVTAVRSVLAQSSDLVRVAEAAPTANRPPVGGQHESEPITSTQLDQSGESETMRTMKIELDPEDSTDLTEITIPAEKYVDAAALAAAIQSELRATGHALLTEATATVREDADGNELIVITAGAATADPDPICKVQGTSGLGGALGFKAPASLRGSERSSTGPMAGGIDGGLGDPVGDYTPALSALRLVDDVNVIVTPNHVADGTDPVPGLVRAHCEAMGDRVQIVDVPAGKELDGTAPIGEVVDAAGTSTYSQTYYPWVRVTNPIHHPDLRPAAPRTVLVPPSGFAAGMWGRIDGRRGVWKAPAGVETSLTGVVGFEFQVGDPDQELLNPAGVNVLRTKPGYGPVIWGARTLATRANPEWRYIPVRRTAIMIEKSLRNGIQWAVFEPNDHNLWASLRLAAESYMDGLFRSGAFQGEKATDAYAVQCGLGSTMKQGDVDRGYVILRVGFAPLKPAEFVVIQIQQLVGQS